MYPFHQFPPPKKDDEEDADKVFLVKYLIVCVIFSVLLFLLFLFG